MRNKYFFTLFFICILIFYSNFLYSQNNPPFLFNIEGTTLSYTEGDAPEDITYYLSITDTDDDSLQSATIQITSGYQNGEDVLDFTSAGGIIGTWDSGSGTLTLTGGTTKFNYRTTLRNVSYENTNTEDPSTVTRTVSFTVNDGDDPSNIVSRNISITAVNDDPVLSAIEGTPVSFTEGGTPVNLTSLITVTDVDDNNMETATIQITSGYQSGEDVLSFTSIGGISGDWYPGSGTLLLSGTSSKTNYNTALQSVTYQNTSEDPTTSTRTVTFHVNDGDDPSNTRTRNINITALNDAPVLSGIETSALNYSEGEGEVEITSTIQVEDVDDTNIESAVIQITGNYRFTEDRLRFTNMYNITGTWSLFNGLLTLSGSDTKAHYQAALRSVAYENTNLFNPSILTRTVSFTVNDGDDDSNTETRDINFTALNDAPVLSGIESAPVSYTEGDPPVNVTSFIDVTDNDDDNMESATIQITSGYQSTEDVLGFTPVGGISGGWNSGTGTLSLSGISSKSNYTTALRSVTYQNTSEDPSTSTRTVTFIVSDGEDPSNPESRNINVSEVNDPPIADNVNISGNLIVNSSLTGSYDYDDPENDPEGSSTYIWYRSEYPDGTGSVEISGADESNYLTVIADGGSYLSFGVIPADNRGGVSPVVFNSDWEYINAGPTPLNLSISGAKAINQTDTASFDYFDLENDPEDPNNHHYQWYRADNSSGHNRIPILGENDRTYTITNDDNHKYIAVEVALAATTGTLLGDVAQSIWYGPISRLPSATISGTTTICPEEETEITISYIGENPPWSVTYSIDGSGSYTLSDIEENEISFFTSIPGVYELVTISDDRYKNVKISGSVTISLYEVSTVELSGIITEICDDGIALAVLEADFTGEAPWSITLDRPGPNDTIYNNITQDPFTIYVQDDGIYRISALSDANCTGDTAGSGSVSVDIIDVPTVTISGLQQAYSIEDDPVPLSGDPPGGTFSGKGIYPGDPVLFIPALAGKTEEGDPPHEIIYSYQFPSGCYGRDTAYVRVLTTTASIVFPDNKTFYCYNDKPFIVEGFNIFKLPEDTSMVIGEFSISGGGIGLVDNGNNTATVYPEILENGIFTITYSKSDGNSFEVTEQFEVQYVYKIFIIGFTDHTYCSTYEPVKLNGNMSGGIFYGNKVTGNLSSGFYFDPQIPPAGLDTIFYSYTTPQGCSRVTFDTATINESPLISFTVDNICIAEQTNDSTQFINNTTSTDSVVFWLWSFGDIGSGEENTSTLKNPKHLYTNARSRQITLSALTDKECQATEEKIINFGDVPVVDFNWESECFHSGIPIQFTNTSTSEQGNITYNEWKFYYGGTYDLSTLKDPQYTYSNYGNYDVELIAKTEYECADTLLKTLHLRKMIIVEEEYFENFEQGVSGWYPDYTNNSTFNTNSWTYGEPEGGFSGAASGIYAWYTDIDDASPAEKSWVKGPCFDFSNTKRPMIKLDIWRLFNQKRDAAVLQYTTDNSQTWHNVGDLEDGINWYNEYNIPVIPGDNSVGWSDIKDNGWSEARHDLDNLKGQTDVQFRIAYGSDGSAINNDGIGFDDIWIGERRKTVLIEHFTNTLKSECTEADNILNNIVNHSNDVIDIQYHTAFPEGDPFYLHNTAASGTREVYYGLSSVPYSMMDGGFTNALQFDYDSKTLEKAVIDTQALKEPLFDLQLITDNTGNSINVQCALTASSDIPESYITLYIVVIEREITQITEENEEEIYESVVKKMLPDPAGTSYFNKSWSAGERVDVNYSWTFANVFDAEEVRVVAFIQNENTREIYQTEIDIREYISSIDDGTFISQPLKILVFPNPTSGITYIKFNQPVNEKCSMQIFNNMGQLLYSNEIYKGVELVHFNTEDFTNGLYIVRIVNKKMMIDVKKLIISR